MQHEEIARRISKLLFYKDPAGAVRVSLAGYEYTVRFDAIILPDKNDQIITLIEYEGNESNVKHIREHLLEAYLIAKGYDTDVRLLFVVSDIFLNRFHENLMHAISSLRELIEEEIRNRLYVEVLPESFATRH